jgi:hypothetical protein
MKIQRQPPVVTPLPRISKVPAPDRDRQNRGMPERRRNSGIRPAVYAPDGKLIHNIDKSKIDVSA